MDYLLGIDIGTSESKGVLTTTEGDIVASHSLPHELELPSPGRVEHDAETTWWGDLRTLSQALLASCRIDPNRILAAACSTIGPCVLPMDKAGRPLRKAILYGIDTRATAEIADLSARLGATEVFRRCGNDLSSQAVGPKLLWIRRHEPEVFARARWFVPGTSYLVWKLTGRWTVDHYSASTFVPLYEPALNGWSHSLAAGIVETDRLPEVTWTTEIAGRVTREASAETGLPEGLPVITGTIDAAAEAVSVGVVEPESVMLMYGSTMFMIAVTRERRADPRIWSAPFLWPGSHALMAGMATAGSLTRWFRDQFARELLVDEAAGGKNAFEVLATAAASVPAGAEGLVILPYFAGERTPINDPFARGMVFGLSLSHTRDHVYRALLESIGFGVRHHLEVFSELGTPVRLIRAVGGGTRNPAWLQILSDICRCRQEVPAITLGACYGDAFLAGIGAGVFGSPNEILNWTKLSRTVLPDPPTGLLYDRPYQLYRDLYENTRPLLWRT